MKKMFIFAALVAVLLACSPPSTRGEVPGNKKLVYKAYSYINLEERKDRQKIKELIGVDPVIYQWCAAFVNAILGSNGLPQSSTVSSAPLTAKSFLRLGKSVWDPEEGDIIVFPRGTEGWQGHVGFYVATEEIDGIDYYWILGGNQNNRVSIEKYPAYNALAIRRVW